MSLQIIIYNIHHKIRKYILILLWIVSIIILLHNKFGSPLMWILVLVAIFNTFHYNIFEVYSKIGLCSIDSYSVSLKYKDRFEHIKFLEILFIYGGYKGKDDGFSFPFTNQIRKSGANNYLIFKKDTVTKVQIMLNSKKEYQQLLDKLSELKASGIKVQEVQYSAFEFGNIMKRFKLSK